MGRQVVRRLVLAVVLLTAIGVFAVDYAASADGATKYPSESALAEDYESYQGERVVVWLRVQSTTEGCIRGETYTVEVDDVPDEVAVGDSVEVAGTARTGRVIVADRIVVTNAENRRYMYGVSALALLGAGLSVLVHWRPSLAAMSLVPRDEEGAAEKGGTDGKPGETHR